MPRVIRVIARRRAPENEKPDRPTFMSTLWGTIKAGLAGFVAFVAFLGGGSLFNVFPNLQPVTSRTVSVETISIEPSVTMGEYSTHSTFRRGAAAYDASRGSCGQILGEAGEWQPNPSRAAEPGIAVTFLLDFSGFAGRCLYVEPVAFDATTMKRLPGPMEMFSVIAADKRESDQAGFELWISERVASEPFVLRLLVFDGDAGHLLTYRDSGRICPPQYLPCPPESAAPSTTSPEPS
jgi:hypothetical protein